MKQAANLFSILLSQIIFAQAPEIEWQNTIGGGLNDGLHSLDITDDGGYILGGYSNSSNTGDKSELGFGGDDYWVVKLDSLGNIQWEHTIGSLGNDLLLAIHQTNDGNYILGGYSDNGISYDKTDAGNGSIDFWLLKIDTVGNILWQNCIGGSSVDYLVTLKITTDGGYILGGYSNSGISGDKSEAFWGGTYGDYWVVKTDSLGNVEWDKTLGGELEERLFDVSQTSDGGYILAGYSLSGISGDKTDENEGGIDYWIIKLDGSGTIEWQKTIGGNFDDYAYSIIPSSDGGYVVAGSSNSNISGDKSENTIGVLGLNDYWIVKLDSIGNILWENTIGGDQSEYPSHVSQTIDGGYILGGTSFSVASGDKTEDGYGSSDYWVVKLGTTGSIQWQTTLGGNWFDNFSTLQQTTDEGFIVGGSSLSGISGDKTEAAVGYGWNDYWVLKLYPSDCVLDIYYADNDGDGTGDALSSITACSLPDGYVYNHQDCDDTNAEIFPFAEEVCNDLDDDCDGDIDDELVFETYYEDADADGFGNLVSSVFGCLAPAGYVADSSDCNDENYLIHPGATEICNTFDDNCNGTADEGLTTIFFLDADEDGFGDPLAYLVNCEMPEGYVGNNLDCDDANTFVNPDAAEICNAIDDNCDGSTDEGLTTIFFQDADEDGFGDPLVYLVNCEMPEGYVGNNLDCDDANTFVNPDAAESCNGLDDNCDGYIDEDLLSVFFIDADNDSYGYIDSFMLACEIPAGYADNNLDCDDSNPFIYPGATEVLDGADNNCNEMIDEGLVSIDEIGLYKFRIYPNPNDGRFYIISQSNLSEKFSVKIYNLVGEEIFAQTFEPALKTEIHLPQPFTGMANVVISTQDGYLINYPLCSIGFSH